MNVIGVALLQPSECHFVCMAETKKISLHSGSISILVNRSTYQFFISLEGE